MKTTDELRDDIGAISGDQLFHVVTRLFSLYENILKRDPDNPEAGRYDQFS